LKLETTVTMEASLPLLGRLKGSSSWLNWLIIIINVVIVHSTKLLNFDWSRAVQLIPNCTPQEYLLSFHGNDAYEKNGWQSLRNFDGFIFTKVVYKFRYVQPFMKTGRRQVKLFSVSHKTELASCHNSCVISMTMLSC